MINYLKTLKKLWTEFAVGIAIAILIGIPTLAYEININPEQPRLGDTIVIKLTNNKIGVQNPTITVENKTYPVFDLGNNQFRGMIPTSPLQKPGDREININNDNQIINKIINISDRKFPIQRITFPPGKAGTSATKMELEKVATLKELVTPQKYWQGKFIPPNNSRMSTGYGVRRYYNGVFAKDYYHRGVDYAGNTGSPVVAPAAGKVMLVGYEKNGFKVHGNVVGVDHGQGVVSIFMHLSKIDVEEGQYLTVGEKLGEIGSTGASTGPHLHWGLYVNNVSIDPLQWLKNDIF